ncbi:MAG TPA: hypothetical protein VL068_03245 [Microthrixaceae bacterium]|nr:hypothetical protein [Microthrixaceae bacterium]
MSTVLNRVTEVQDQVITAITNVNEPLTNAVNVAVAFVVENAPQIPALPFADKIPTPKELINNQARFASKLVTTNKAVALSIATAAAPLTDQILDRKTPAARTTKAA